MTPLVDLVGLTLIHFTWQGVVIGVTTAATLRALARRSSQARYLAACLALLAMLIAPMITAVTISNGGMRRVSVPAPADAPLAVSPVDRAIDVAGSRTTASAPASWTNRDLLLPLVVGWAVGVFVSLLRLTTAWWRVRVLHRASLRAVASVLQPIADRLADRIGLSRLVHVVESIHVETPSVIGSLRPVILLPIAAFAALTPAQVEAILAHELAHICRRDYLVNMIQSIAEALLFFHPAVWWVSRRIRAEREHCCDDMAVALCGDAVDYAKALAHLATWQRSAVAPLAAAAAGGSLLNRIQRLVGEGRQEVQPRANLLTLTMVVMLLVVIGSGLSYSSSTALGFATGPHVAMNPRSAVTTVASFRLVPPPPAPPPAPLPGLQADLAFTPTDHFDVYFPQQLRGRIDVIVRTSEDAYAKVSADLRHELPSRPVVILFATRAELDRAPGIVKFGATPSAPRILIAADGATARLAGAFRHEVTHAFAFDFLPSGSAPRWIQEGLAEYERGDVDGASLTALRALAARNALPAVTRIDTVAFPSNPRLDDALGAQVFEFIASRWGWDGIRRLLFATRISKGPRPDVFVTTFGMSADAFDDALQRYLESTAQIASAALSRSIPAADGGRAGSASGPLSFDAISIRPSTADTLQSRLMAQPGGLVIGRNVTLKTLIRQAYNVTEQELDGGPGWLDSWRFDFDARAPSDVSVNQLQVMLQTMLSERFDVVAHRESRERPIFALVKARSDGRLGSELRPATVDCAALAAANGGRVAPSPTDTPLPARPTCGTRFSPGLVVSRGMAIDRLAANLSALVGRIVIDGTELTGSYDFDLQWTSGRPEPPSGPNEPAVARPDRAALFTAVEEQLGLKLEPRRGVVDVLVIDAAARPSEN